jgi:hypothetical protein
MQALQVQCVRLGASRSDPCQLCLVATAEFHAQCAGDGAGDGVLDREHVLKIHDVRFRPLLRNAVGIDETDIDAYAASVVAHLAFEQRADSEPPTDGAQVVFQVTDGGLRNSCRLDAEPGELAESVGDFERHAVGEGLILRRSAHVRAREHGDRYRRSTR